MKSLDQADSGGDWRVQLKQMRTVAALLAATPTSDAAERLTDRALIAAAQNPDHSESGRAIAAGAARARNVTISPWRLRVPGFLTPRDLAKGQRLFFGWGQRVRRLAGVGAALVLIAVIAFGAFDIWRSQSMMARVAFDLAACVEARQCAPEQAAAELAASQDMASGVFVLIGLALFLALLWLAATLLRRKPARVAVFAPPLHTLTRAPLRRFARKELRPFGHVMLHEADGPIRTAAAYRAAASLMADKLAMNFCAARPSGVALRIGGSTAWAPLTRAMGVDSADVVVVDLSSDPAVTLAALSADPQRCVFVALWGQLEAADAALAARGIGAVVHHYAPDGEIQRRASFRAAMLKAISA